MSVPLEVHRLGLNRLEIHDRPGIGRYLVGTPILLIGLACLAMALVGGVSLLLPRDLPVPPPPDRGAVLWIVALLALLVGLLLCRGARIALGRTHTILDGNRRLITRSTYTLVHLGTQTYTLHEFAEVVIRCREESADAFTEKRCDVLLMRHGSPEGLRLGSFDASMARGREAATTLAAQVAKLVGVPCRTEGGEEARVVSQVVCVRRSDRPRAAARRMVLLPQSDEASAREHLRRLARAGFSPQIERVVPTSEGARQGGKQEARWSLSVPVQELQAAKRELQRDPGSASGEDGGAPQGARGRPK